MMSMSWSETGHFDNGDVGAHDDDDGQIRKGHGSDDGDVGTHDDDYEVVRKEAQSRLFWAEEKQQKHHQHHHDHDHDHDHHQQQHAASSSSSPSPSPWSGRAPRAQPMKNAFSSACYLRRGVCKEAD